MMKKLLLYGVFASAGILILLLFVFSSQKENPPDSTYRQAFHDSYKIFSVEIPEKIDFAGEPAPLDLFYVREMLDRELLINTYWHTSTILLIKRANRWFPVIEPILKKNGIPDDFKYLALIESGLMNVVSPKGATGFWQFLEKTAREYGLEVNKEIDERYNVEKSTEAACRYLLDSYDEFGDWTLVAAAYNAGRKRVENAIEKQKTKDYYNLYLNDETSRYIFRIMAIKTIYQNPTKYGFYIRESDLYPFIPTINIKVENTIPDLVEFAHKNGVSYKILKLFNPWLRSGKLPDESHKTYYIKLPERQYLDPGSAQKLLGSEQEIFHDTLQVNDL